MLSTFMYLLYVCKLSYRYRHVNLLQLIACSMDGPTPCLIYDYMEQGSLLDVLQRRVNTYTIFLTFKELYHAILLVWVSAKLADKNGYISGCVPCYPLSSH